MGNEAEVDMKAVIYARYSSENQREESISDLDSFAIPLLLLRGVCYDCKVQKRMSKGIVLSLEEAGQGSVSDILTGF
jgi:hypothetical protein